MKESQIQTLFSKVIDEQGVFELKLAKGNSIPYKAVKPHQIEALQKAKHSGIFHKISDSPIFAGMKSRFTAKKPFDCLHIQCPAYVAICFYKPRKKKEIYLIDIDKFIATEKIDVRKSLTEKTASIIAYRLIKL